MGKSKEQKLSNETKNNQSAIMKPTARKSLNDPLFMAGQANTLARSVTLCHQLAVESGWWTDLKTGERINPNIGEKLCLIHSEISEAMEGARKGLQDDHLPHRTMVEVELADAVIRIFDLAGGMGWDLANAMVEKLKYNATRADHQPENRRSDGGKKF